MTEQPHASDDPTQDADDLPPAPEPQADGTSTAAETVDESAVAKALAESEDRYLRLAAEYDNYRRRTLKEKGEAVDRGARALVERLLDELDDLDRMAASDPATTSYEAFRAAFMMLKGKFAKELEGAGLERIEPTGGPFDPNEHDAVAVVAPESPDQDHTVKATFQAGYRFKGQVVRPARVQVYSEQGVA